MEGRVGIQRTGGTGFEDQQKPIRLNHYRQGQTARIQGGGRVQEGDNPNSNPPGSGRGNQHEINPSTYES